jgi:hypothetical protein
VINRNVSDRLAVSWLVAVELSSKTINNLLNKLYISTARRATATTCTYITNQNYTDYL